MCKQLFKLIHKNVKGQEQEGKELTFEWFYQKGKVTST
jgi:hypothetical protein